MNKVWFYCEGDVVPSGVFDAVVALRGTPGGDNSQCRWPEGDTRSPDFRFCDSDALAGMVYCAHHCRISYQPKG